MCYVNHHDEAYQWAERRRLETHPTTGAAQLVVVHEKEELITIPTYVAEKGVASPLFVGVSKEKLLGFGIPVEWLDVVLRVSREDELLELADQLPGEAAESLLDLFINAKPMPRPSAAPGNDPFSHPDARRRFRAMGNLAELERAQAIREMVIRELDKPTEIRTCRSTFTAHYNKHRKKIHVSNLGTQPWLPIEALEFAFELVTSYGKAKKGSAQKGKLGDDNLPMDSVEGVVASKAFDKQSGDSVFRRITPIAGLLAHLGLARDDCDGYLKAVRQNAL